MKQKWYLQTWFICILFIPSLFAIAAPPFIVFPILGIILIILQNNNNKKILKGMTDYNTLLESIDKLQSDYSNKNSELKKAFADEEAKLQKNLADIRKNISVATHELNSFEENLLERHYTFSEYDGVSSEECRNKLSLLKANEAELIKSDRALLVTSTASRKEINDNKKQILRCFNSECDNILMNLSVKNIDSMRNKITKSFETLNKIFQVDGVSISNQLLEYKLEELNLTYTYELKKEQELELQKEIKAQMLEEEKVRREIERQKAKIEKDQAQCTNEVKKLMSYLQKSKDDVERQLYVDKIKELEEKLKSLEKEKETVLDREANAKAGYVYVISNIGSFGENIYKIGMTRRLEPMDRIKELSSASVPFEFDVHAMIFSDNAPELENILHKTFENKSVNRVNLRKEFFKVSIDEIEKVVKNNYNKTADFTRIPVAAEYRQTLSIIASEQKVIGEMEED
jgi:hypothetical protein